MMSSSFVARRSLFFPGLAPQLQRWTLQLPLPRRVKAFVAHPAGPFTIHFWAPTFKWGISLANIFDFFDKDVASMSLEQQAAVACTGIIWSRYSMIITPKNWNLFSVNVAMAITGSLQLCRIAAYKLSIIGREEKTSQVDKTSAAAEPGTAS